MGLRKTKFDRGVIFPATSYSPEEWVMGTSPTYEQSLSKLLKRLMVSSSDKSGIAATNQHTIVLQEYDYLIIKRK